MTESGKVYAWGQNSQGQVGVNAVGRETLTSDELQTNLICKPIVVFPFYQRKEGSEGLLKAKELPVQIIAYEDFSFVLCKSGRVYSWGSTKSLACLPEDARTSHDPMRLPGFLGRLTNE